MNYNIMESRKSY